LLRTFKNEAEISPERSLRHISTGYSEPCVGRRNKSHGAFSAGTALKRAIEQVLLRNWVHAVTPMIKFSPILCWTKNLTAKISVDSAVHRLKIFS